MSERIKEHIDSRTKKKPAVGLVATEDNGESLAATILRARQGDFDVYVAHLPDRESEAVKFARELEAKTVKTKELNPSLSDCKDVLVSRAKREGYPGLMFCEDAGRKIGFSDTFNEWRGSRSYLIEALEDRGIPENPEILVAIPAYNEEESIEEVVTEVKRQDAEPLVVDDGSDDETVTKARNAGATVVEHGHNKGYGAALQTAFGQASNLSTDHLVIIDGDGQHDASDIQRLVETQRDTDADIVIGSRFVRESNPHIPLYRKFGLGVVNLLTNLSFGIVRGRSRIQDTQSGFRCYNRHAVDSLSKQDICNDMGASTDILSHAIDKNFDIEEIPTRINYDVEDASSQNPVRHGLHLIMNLLRTVETKRPILALGVPGFLMVFLGSAFGYWTLSNYLSSGTLALGLGLLTMFFISVGFLSSFTAMILHSLDRHLPNDE